MSPILGIAGGALGLFFVWFFMLRKKGKIQSMSSPKNNVTKKVIGEVVDESEKEKLIRQLLARGALTKEEADKARADIKAKKEQSVQSQMPVAPVVTGAGSIAVVPQSAVAIMSQKYRAMVFSEEEGISFKFITKKLGNPVYLEPSMPSRGSHLLIVEKDGKWSAYDPRLEAFASAETPHRAYSAVNCYELVSAVYANKLGLWEKVNTILVALMGCGFILVAIVAVDKLSK
jgi:hypothetical protein